MQLPPSTTSLLANIAKASVCQKGRWKTKVEEGEVTIKPVLARKTKEGLTLLTVETEANGVLRVQMKRVLSWLVHWTLSCRYKRFLSCLGCTNRPSKKNFLATTHYFTSFVSIAQQAGQAVVLRRQYINMCLWF